MPTSYPGRPPVGEETTWQDRQAEAEAAWREEHEAHQWPDSAPESRSAASAASATSAASAAPIDRLPAPENLLEFQRMFPDEAACIDYLIKVRWPSGFSCPKCGSTKGWLRQDRRAIECSNQHDTSLTANTAMHRTKLPLQLWFHAAYLIGTLTPGISALQFQKQLGIKRYETAYQMLHKLRSSLVDPEREPLHGEIEVDEGFVGGKEEGRPGRGSERKALVIFAVEVIRYRMQVQDRKTKALKEVERTRAGRIRASVIPDASAETLLPWVEKNIKQGSLVYTDGWSGYSGLKKLGYNHVPILQSHKGKETGNWLPMVHLIVSNLKRWILGTHKGAVEKRHLPAYLNEFVFRFNRRFWRGPAFLRILGFMLKAETWPQYETLYHVGEEGGWRHPNPRPESLSDELVAALLEEAAVADSPRAAWINEHDAAIRVVVESTVGSAL